MLSKDNNLLRKNTYFCNVKPFKMFRFRIIPVLFFQLAVFFPAVAQDNTPFVRRVLDKLLELSVELDPEAVYQPAARWTFALTGDLRQAGISQYNFFDMGVDDSSEGVTDVISNIWTSAETRLRGDIHKVVGFQVGYGNISFSLGKKIGSGGTNSTYAFDYMNAGYALQVQYFSYSQPVDYSFVIGVDGEALYDETGVTEDPGSMKAFIADAMYAFNRRSFAYSAAYKGNKMQRRSAGSWMFGTKLMLSEYMMEPGEEVVQWAGGQARHTSTQISFGGGYSFNFVPFHRQPYGDREKGLRNLVFNVTALPMVTLFNQFTATHYELDPDADTIVFIPVQKAVMNGRLKFNYIARAGIGFTRDLFTVNLSASVDSFVYQGEMDLPDSDWLYRWAGASGEFTRWSVGLRLCRCF